MKKLPKIICIFLLISLAVFITACGKQQEKPKVKDIDFTVVPDADLPQALTTLIEEKKTGDMMMTYATENELYIVRGYGTRPTDGYSVTVDDCYMTEDRLYFGTTLTGPDKSQSTTSLPSYPYIVIKTEYIDIPVDFE